MQLIGQKNNLELLNTWENLPSLLIIQGEEHTGKTYLALYIAKKFGLTYAKIGNGVKEVRSVVKTAVKDSKMLYHFKDFHTASMQAKNALLKLTEEAPRNVFIVITGGKQIATLESRGRKLIMEPYSEREIKSYAKDLNYSNNLIDRLYKFGLNTPAKLDFYKDFEDLTKIIDFSEDVYRKITLLEIDDIVLIANEFSYLDKKEKVDRVLLFLSMLSKRIEYNISTSNYIGYKRVLEGLIDAKADIKRTDSLNRVLLLYSTFYKLYQKQQQELNVGVDR